VTGGVVAVAATLWLPPLVDQLIHDPGNLGQIVNYALSDRSGTRPSNAVRAIGNEMSAFPFAKDEPKPFHDSDIQWYRHRNPVIAAAPFLYLGAAAVLTVIAIRRQRRIAALLGVVAGIATVAAL